MGEQRDARGRKRRGTGIAEDRHFPDIQPRVKMPHPGGGGADPRSPANVRNPKPSRPERLGV